MTPVQKTAAIRDLLSANLPDLLSTAGLDNFDEYRNKSPLRSDDNEICTYIITDDNEVNNDSFGVIIRAQIYGKDLDQEYHSVIKPFLESDLTGSVVGMTQRTSIKSDLYPMEINGSTAYILYSVIFDSELDDCDD